MGVAYGGPDPRLALRGTVPDGDEVAAIRKRLASMDKRGAWTDRVLGAIRRHPGVPARVMAEALDVQKDKLKPRVRRLGDLGLTLSLERGYRLSPRGAALFGSPNGLDVAPLRESPGDIPYVAHYYLEAWEAYYGPTGPGDAAADVRADAQDGLPMGFVATRVGEFAGVASLRAVSLPSHTQLSPWLAGLLVLEGHRGHGVSDALVRAVERCARDQGFPRLFVATAIDSRRMVERGWRPMDTAPTLQGGVPVLALSLT